jgi:hypothetical protein
MVLIVRGIIVILAILSSHEKRPQTRTIRQAYSQP